MFRGVACVMNALNATNAARAAGAKVSCRTIEADDIPAIVALLCEGFPERARPYWEAGFARMRDRPVPDGYPRYGHLLSVGDEIVGCLLLLVSCSTDGVLRANVSSWYAKPDYRSLASMLVSVAFKRKELTFINISPAPHTVPILQAQGYERFVAGQFVTAPVLAGPNFGTKVRRVGAGNDDAPLPASERDLLRRHAGYGALSLVCSRGEDHEPFVFVRKRLMRGFLPAAQLVWCRDVNAFARCAGPLGRALLRHGIAAVSLDANGPISGLRGAYREGSGVKFARGPHRPRLGDLADTELVVFGV